MHKTLTEIQTHLGQIIARLQSVVPSDEPLGNAHGNWSFPGLTRAELIEEAQSISDEIEARGGDELGGQEARLQDYLRRLQHLESQTIQHMWGNAAQAVPAYLLTLDGLRKALAPVLDEHRHADNLTKLKELSAQLRSMEARLRGLDPRTAALSTMVERIERAYNAAEQLPTDLETLSEARQKITDLAQTAGDDQVRIADLREKSEHENLEVERVLHEADLVLERCETAYSAATSVGLAAAFDERSKALAKSMWFWIGGLIAALGAGSFLGGRQLQALSELFKLPDASTSVIVLNLVLSLLAVGAPIWFAWLATKQIGQRFRLSEDYAFKASISRAYEGFRREAARVDKTMETKLLSSALSRLDELPLRLVETASHGSPWHELASSDTVKQAIKAVPGFAEQVKDLASRSLGAVKPIRATPKQATAQGDGQATQA